MPRESKDRKGSGNERRANPEFKGFVDFTVSDAEHEHFDEWVKGAEEALFWKGLMSRLEGGYKLSLAADTVNECYIATLICNVHDSPDAGWCLTARDDSAFGAMMLLFWKDEILLKGSWIKNKGARGKRNFG
jgi:hypothetical protein